MNQINPHCKSSYRTNQVPTGHYCLFQYPGYSVHMDANSLALWRLEHNEHVAMLPKASRQEPVFPVHPMKHCRALVLNLTHNCNLRCKYCYMFKYYPQQDNMSEETAQRAIDQCLADSPGPVRLGFFGGEALLQFPLIRHLVPYAKSVMSEKSVQFSVTTNGTLITPEIADFLALHKFSMIVSLDGGLWVHDRNRKDVQGNGSFQQVLKGLDMLRAAGVQKITLRATYGAQDQDILERAQFLNAVCDGGLASNVSIEPSCLTESLCGDQQGHSNASVAALEDPYRSTADYLAGRLLQGKQARFHNILVFAERLVYGTPYCSTCGGGMGYMAVNPGGEVFACHREMSSKIGTLDHLDPVLRDPWADNRFHGIPECQVCLYHHLCGGACREHNLTAMKDITKVDPVACAFNRLYCKSAVRLLDRLGTTDHRRYIAQKGVPRQKDETKQFVLLREAGGYGDIICLDGAARQIKVENPGCRTIACVPDDFYQEAQHLAHIDEVVPLDFTGVLPDRQRRRALHFTGQESLREQYPYLKRVPRGIILDCACPGCDYEHHLPAGSPVAFTRTQLFALEAGVKQTDQCIPKWKATKQEIQRALAYFATLPSDRPVVGFSPFGTQDEKSLTHGFAKEVAQWLAQTHNVLMFLNKWQDLFQGMDNVYLPSKTFTECGAILAICDYLVTIDTGAYHLGVAVETPTLCLFGPTDSTALSNLYPKALSLTASNINGKTACQMPCNMSVAKGWTSLCRQVGGCPRTSSITLKDIQHGFAQLKILAGSQQQKIENLLKGTER